MDLKQIRLSNLDQYLKRECGGNAAELARRIKRSPSQVNDLFAGRKSFGEKFARAIEKDMGVADGWLDSQEGENRDGAKSAKASLSLSLNLSETGLSQHAAKLVRLIRQQDKAGSLSTALAQTIEQVIRVATTPANPGSNEPAVEPPHQSSSTPGILADNDPALLAAIGRVRQHDIASTKPSSRKKSPGKA